MELTAILIVSTGVKLLIDNIRKAFPALNGTLVNVLAFAIGYAATYIPLVLEGNPEWPIRATVAAAVAGVSHLFAEATEAAQAISDEGLHS